jgi:pimeloyl-ACP methyl ester carboxylesterase
VADAFSDLDVKAITANGVALSNSFLYRAGSGVGGIILVEAVNRSQEDRPLELELVIQKKSTGEIESTTSMWIQTSPVEEMFRHINLQSIPGLTTPNAVDRKAFPNRLVPRAYPDKRTTEDYFVFLHGYNVMGELTKGWQSEMFKRMYQTGFKGRFVGVAWHGASDGAIPAPDYHVAIFDAFVTSKALAAEVPKYTEGASTITLAGHSMGNIVISNAISQFGLAYNKYFMIDAAVPIEAYDVEQVSAISRGVIVDDMSKNMTEADWLDYDKDVLASQWHALFNEDDPRRALTWREKFKPALTNAYNFYSSGENILENAGKNEWVTAGMWETAWGAVKGRHSWVVQEIGKGCQSQPFGWTNKPCQAGWNFNVELPDLNYLAPTVTLIPDVTITVGTPDIVNAALRRLDGDPKKLTDEALAQFGFFSKFAPFADNIYAAIDEGNEINDDIPSRLEMEELMSNEETTWRILASGIPARSFAVGANSLSSLDAKIGVPSHNYDMQELRKKYLDGQPDWPADRVKGKKFDFDWFHSDIKDVAFPFVYNFFDKMNNLIEEE